MPPASDEEGDRLFRRQQARGLEQRLPLMGAAEVSRVPHDEAALQPEACPQLALARRKRTDGVFMGPIRDHRQS